jgi:hypothetical protein
MMCIIRRPEGVLRSRLRAQPESEIDYSDIPQLQEDFWKKAVRNPFYRPTKTSTTVRIDSDVALLVIPFLEGCLVILTPIKDAENGYLVSIHLERDHNAFSVAGYS